MERFPTVITTSVVRSAHQGESHGGIYLVDLESGKYSLMVDWNNSSIDWEGRGGDRGLRGIAFHENRVFIAASDEIIIYDSGFNRCSSLKSPYLKHCHEIFSRDGLLYVCSTGYDSILVYSFAESRFILGYCIRASDRGKLEARAFDPASLTGPTAGDTLHLNNVFADESGIHVSGYRLTFLLLIDSQGIQQYGRLPGGTHNARPYLDGIIYNDTAGNRVAITRIDGSQVQCFPIHQYETSELTNNDLPQDHARQGFGRGLCMTGDGNLIIAGSSPSTISVCSVKTGEIVRRINLSMDVRNAIHGLEIWPFA